MEKMVRLSSAKFGLKTQMHCIKLLGDKLSARSFDSQVNEIHARVAVLNRFTELGRPLTQVTPLNLAQLGVLCISNLCATKPIQSKTKSYRLFYRIMKPFFRDGSVNLNNSYK